MSRALVIVLVSLAACAPTLTAQSPAPPGRAARLDEVRGFWGIKGYRMAISQGVALAVTCTSGGPCERLQATSDDPAIAEVHAASLGVLQANALSSDVATAAAIVVVGKAAGRTLIHVTSREGGRTIKVEVSAPPASASD